MAPRAIWTGTISFGLVNVPVRMYSAIDEQDLHFHYVHERDGSRIGYQKVCKAEGKPVADDEIVKAFEVEKGEYVTLDDADFEAARQEGTRTIEITDFVPYEQIDPIHFERTYYLGPQAGAEKVYALLREAMKRSQLAAIATYVLRDREHLGCLRIRDDAITLEKMFFAAEIRPLDGIAPEDAKVGKRELELAVSLIDQFTGDWDPSRYEDTYTARLTEIVEAKRKGETLSASEPEAPEEPADLLAALRASVEAAKGTRRKPTTRATRKPARKAAVRR